LILDPNVKNVEQYLENSKDLLTKTPEEALESKIIDGYNRTMTMKHGPQKTDTKEIVDEKDVINLNAV